ncbi:peptidoglycan-binding domain-containing protein [Paracoccus laeviglucosivorans]|uniref:Peptidoglycan binding domain-containing protein n=1 Tax=Paracoccus laeviglucosivorans TaxID=1197861 RepID=A0A521E8C1_9RHOB|nr:peptidoglycan-binding domain-containing protein [Paracoccus laeviglucosivorans]SMO79671.1 Putative peptidoglycan binding domain-containing protein [Paracoccus laeviglucosivorans]
MSDGSKMFALSETRIGEKYILGAPVPKNNSNWHGPWDCAEFTSWLVYQIGQVLYGCTDNNSHPASADDYTGAWQNDSQSLGIRIPISQAAQIRGAFVLRYPPGSGKTGHIAISDGKGGTVEAMGKNYGVRRGKIAGRVWDVGVLIPDFTYDTPTGFVMKEKTVLVFKLGATGKAVEKIQKALAAAGFDPGPIDKEYGPMTAAAVGAYQAAKGLIVDGQVGPNTAKKLKIDLT